MNKKPVVIATIRPWNIERYNHWTPPSGFVKHLISKKEKLTHEHLSKIRPRYVFFPHWSWIIPPKIYKNFECVIFHETDLPFGRGGSPLQNLIARGIYKTKVSAIGAVGELDAGPVYLKRPLDLSSGSAGEIFKDISWIIFSMIDEILTKNPKPKLQHGKPVIFRRRKPSESRIPPNLAPRKMYDFIRMLDAEGYPPAFLGMGRYHIEFKDADLKNDKVEARVIIKYKDKLI